MTKTTSRSKRDVNDAPVINMINTPGAGCDVDNDGPPLKGGPIFIIINITTYSGRYATIFDVPLMYEKTNHSYLGYRPHLFH
jgi:hypothetical protein